MGHSFPTIYTSAHSPPFRKGGQWLLLYLLLSFQAGTCRQMLLLQGIDLSAIDNVYASYNREAHSVGNTEGFPYLAGGTAGDITRLVSEPYIVRVSTSPSVSETRHAAAPPPPGS